MPDSQTLGLFIAAAIAGAVCFRLYWVLGRRTGQEPSPQSVPSPLNVPLPQAVTGPGSSGLLDIQHADRDFDTPKFLEGARQAYGLIVTAFEKGDRDALRPLLSADVMAAFEAGIAARQAPAAAFIQLIDARISAAVLDERQAEITVAFTATFATGAVTDVWTFARSLDAGDPNWVLVATAGDLPE